MSTEERFKKILLRNLDVKEEALVPSAALRSELGATSVDIVEILADLENEFNVEIPDADAAKLRTFGDVVKYLDERVQA
jgi:acyl carrier protein